MRTRTALVMMVCPHLFTFRHYAPDLYAPKHDADLDLVTQTRLPVTSVIVVLLPVQPAAMTALVVVPVALHLPAVMVMPTGQCLSPLPFDTLF
jgi:hypothetical protein